jgi:hypothetical protein
MSKFASGTSLMMYHVKPDDRLDDNGLTPKTRNLYLNFSKSNDRIFTIEQK